VGEGHELVQGRPTNDGVEGEIDLCNIKDHASSHCGPPSSLLLLVLVELLRELLDLLALLGIVAPVSVADPHHCRRVGMSLVTAWAMDPTGRCSNSNNGGSTCKLLLLDFFFLLFLPLL
jgi:hypothetical protein